MANVGYATLSVIPSMQGFQSSLGAQLGGSAVTATAKKQGSKLGSVFGGSITRAIGTSIIGYAAFTAITGAVGAAKSAVIDFNAQQQNARIAFTNFFGSAKKADTLMRQLLNFARTTPFEIGGLTQNAQSLLAMGISAKDLIPTLTAVGDAVAAVGGDAGTLERVNTAVGQIAAKGRVQGEELRQLTENGIPAVRILANQYHLSQAAFLEFVTAGKVNAAKALPLLLEGIEKGTKGVNGETAKMGGLMKAQSTTFTGALSNVKDGFNQVVGQGFKPFFDVISSGMASLATILGSDKAKNMALNFSHGLEQGFSGARKIIAAISKALKPPKLPGGGAGLLGKPGANPGVVAPVRKPQGGGPGMLAKPGANPGVVAKAPKVDNSGKQIESTIKALSPMITQLGNAWKQVSGSFLSGFGRIVTAAKTLGPPLLKTFQDLWKVAGPKVMELADTLSTGFTEISTMVSTQLIPAFKKIMPILTPIVGFFLGVFLSAVIGAIKGVINIIKGLINIFVGVVNVIDGLVHGRWSQVWQGLGQIVKGAFQLLKGIIQVAWNVGIIGMFRRGLAVIRGIFSGGFRALLSAPRAMINGVKAIVKGGLALIRDTFRVYMSITKSVWKAAWGTFASVVRVAKNAVLGVVRGILSAIKGVFSGAKSLLSGVGSDIVNGLIGGIKAGVGRVTSAASSLVSAIPGTVKKLLHINSPSKVMHKIAEGIPEGLINGMKSKKAGIRSATAALVNDVKRGFEGKLTGTIKQIQAALNDLANDLDKAHRYHAANTVDYVQKILVGYAKQRDALAKQVKAQKSLIADLKKQKSDLVAAVSGKITDSSSFLDFGSSIDGILAKLKSSKAIAGEFEKGLAALKKAGLNQTSLLQLANADPETAITSIRTLLGNKGAIKQINGLVGDISKLGKKAGSTAGSVYDAGIKTAEGFLKGLQSKEAKIIKYMRQLAAKLAKELRKSLKVKSPSQVTREIGGYTGQGLALGLADQGAAVQKAANKMLPNFPKALDTPRGMKNARQGSTDASTFAIHVHLGDREITDIVKVEVKKENTTTARALTNGRR